MTNQLCRKRAPAVPPVQRTWSGRSRNLIQLWVRDGGWLIVGVSAGLSYEVKSLQKNPPKSQFSTAMS